MSKYVTLDRVAVISVMARKNITSDELTQRASVGRSSVYKVRKGKSVYRTTAQHIAAALGVPPEELLEEGGGAK